MALILVETMNVKTMRKSQWTNALARLSKNNRKYLKTLIELENNFLNFLFRFLLSFFSPLHCGR